MQLSPGEKEFKRTVDRQFYTSLVIGSLALGYWTDSFAAMVVFVSSGIALEALACKLAILIGTYIDPIALLLEKEPVATGTLSLSPNNKRTREDVF